MKVRATAAASDRSNAIGTVELEATPHGLALTYLGVGAFAEGYAPGALTSGTRITVPWNQIVEARAEGDQLFLSVQPRLTPHHRLVLRNFTSGDVVDPRELFRQRLVLRIGGAGAALVGMLLVTLTLPLVSTETTAAGALGIGVATAVAVLGVAAVADLRLRRGADEPSVRHALVGELSLFLPNLGHSAQPPPPRRRPWRIPDFQGWLPRTTFAISVTLASGILATLLMARWIISGGPQERYPEPRIARAEPNVQPAEPAEPRPAAAPVVAPPAEPATPPPSDVSAPPPAEPAPALGGSCNCVRATNALWSEPLPRLSALLLGQRVIRRPEKKPRLEVTIAAVNNGDEDISDVTMMVHFLEQDPPPSSKTYEVANRPLYFEGPLVPGQAIKWTVDARGTTFRLEHNYTDTLDPGGTNAAPTNLLAELLHAIHRPVRLHGAMVLAYLGDPRARPGVLHLRDALREDEAPYLQRLLRATADLRVCQLQVTGAGTTRQVNACVFNASQEPKKNVGIRVRALEHAVSHLTPLAAPPLVVAENKWKAAPALAPQTGTTFTTTIELPATALETTVFEAYADRYDLLD